MYISGDGLSVAFFYFVSPVARAIWYNNPMEHYICTGGCRAVSETPGTCQAEDCSKRGEPFEPCECEDGKHDGKQGGEEEEKMKE